MNGKSEILPHALGQKMNLTPLLSITSTCLEREYLEICREDVRTINSLVETVKASRCNQSHAMHTVAENKGRMDARGMAYLEARFDMLHII
jgi:hypothetical protein